MNDATHSTSSTQRPKKVFLYVDDCADDCLIMRMTVKKLCEDLDLRTVQDCEAAVAWLSGTGIYADRTAYPLPDLLLTDLHMPRFSGMELLRWVRNHPKLAALPVVVYSDLETPDIEEKCRALGVEQYIKKGIGSTSINGFLNAYMAYHSLQPLNAAQSARPAPPQAT